jgi:phage shock protein A
MWNRLKRLFRSIFGGIIESAEDPELILQQLIRDMNDEVPKMRNNVAQVMATEKRLEHEIKANQTSLNEIDNKIKAAIRTGHDDIAATLIGELQLKQRSLETSKQNYEQAKVASAKAREFLDNYMAQVRRRQAEAMQLISATRQALKARHLRRSKAASAGSWVSPQSAASGRQRSIRREVNT